MTKENQIEDKSDTIKTAFNSRLARVIIQIESSRALFLFQQHNEEQRSS